MNSQDAVRQPQPLKNIMGSTLARAVAAILFAVTVVEVIHFSYTLFFVQKKNQEIISEIAFSTIQEPIEQGGFVEANRRMGEMIKKGYFACAKLSAWDFNVDHCEHTKLYFPAVVHREIGLGQGTAKAGDLFIYFDQREFVSSIVFRLLIDIVIIAVIGMCLKLFFDRSSKKIYGQLDKIVANATRPSGDEQGEPSLAEGFDILEFDIVSREITRKIRENMELSRSAAVARMTQMVAHDVRRPFSMLKMLLEGISKAKTPAQIQTFASMGIPETVRAMNSVNGLIQDVMEIGSVAEIFPAAVKPETLLEAALGDIFQTFPEARISISYSLNHSFHANVEASKVLRVFANIIGNAAQAMNADGKIWIRTEDALESGQPAIEFVIGNSGPHIPEEHLPKLFEAFFTSGKKGGTGLGLAIAHKIVVAHRGRIWCESAPERGVEFHFTLPAASLPLTADSSNLPKSSQDILTRFQTFGSSAVEDDEETQLEISLKELLPRLGRKLSVLIVDDEIVYRETLASGLTRDAGLAELLEITRAEGSEGAAAGQGFDVAIVDVDLGPKSLSGFEIVSDMRKRNELGFVCIHSNRVSASDSKTAIHCGADAFLPKPMGRAHLLKLLHQALERIGIVGPILLSSGNADTAPASGATASPVAMDGEMLCAFVDDMKTVRMAWEAGWTMGTLKTFASPENFWAQVDAVPGFLDSLACVITDLNFGNASVFDGKEFAMQIRNRSDVPVLVASNSDVHIEDFSGTIDGILGKEPPSKEVLAGFLKKHR